MIDARIVPIGLALAFLTSSVASAQYITNEQQRQQAEQHLQEHRAQQQQGGSNPSVQSSTNTVQGSTNTYGKEWQEQQLQGKDPKVNRSW